MKLTEIFGEAIRHSDKLVELHDRLTTRNQRRIRPEWSKRFYAARLTDWPMRDGLWRSKNDTILIVGTKNAGLSHKDFASDALLVFLRVALVMAMAAIDKVLHEAVSRRFVALVKKEKLDKLVDLELSKAYRIAIEARAREGKGGRIRKRPGPKIKAEALEKLYRESFLSLRRLHEICSACGKKTILERFGNILKPRRSSKYLHEEWSRLYARRNQIAHDCDIVRKSRARKIHLHMDSTSDLKNDIRLVRNFGEFLARELE